MTRRAISIDVIRIPTKGPGDVSGLIQLIEAGRINPASILAILGKTEGNGGVNDFTREYATSALLAALGGRRNVGDVECLAGRVLVRIADPKIVDERALRTLGIRGVARPTAGSMQLLIPGSAEDWAQPLRQLLA